MWIKVSALPLKHRGGRHIHTNTHALTQVDFVLKGAKQEIPHELEHDTPIRHSKLVQILEKIT